VASDLPAIRGLLNEGQSGRLFRAGDAGDLALTVTELLADSESRNALAENGRQHVLSRYDWNTISRRYASMLMPNAPMMESGAGHE
jgi:glycosyltransferase involved in cell wall biosynthesis